MWNYGAKGGGGRIIEQIRYMYMYTCLCTVSVQAVYIMGGRGWCIAWAVECWLEAPVDGSAFLQCVTLWSVSVSYRMMFVTW